MRNTCTCTDLLLSEDLSDHEVFKIVGTLLGNWEDGGICVWLVTPINGCETFLETMGDAFVSTNLDLQNLTMRYKRVTKDAWGWGFVVDPKAYVRAALSDLEILANFAYLNDMFVTIEPLGDTKNCVLLKDGTSEVK